MADYIEIEHVADVSFRVHGANLHELFENAARSMLEVQSQRNGSAPVTRAFTATGDDRETLLVNFLNEILYLQDVHGEIYCECTIQVISDRSLQAKVLGQPRVRSYRLIKAVTFHNLKIEPVPDGLQVTLVMDV